MKKENKKIIVGAVILIAIIGLISAINVINEGSNEKKLTGLTTGATLFKSPSCGCCEVYSKYFEKKGNINLEIRQTDEIEKIKQEQGIPANMRSCHTTIIDNYVIEGHVPIEAVKKLLTEKPNIKGIAMPGMPSGSPGMPGIKKGDFIIYAINNDGSTTEYMRI